MLTISSIVVAGLFTLAPAPAPAGSTQSSQDADERARVGTTHVYEFEADDLDGRVLTAEGTRIRDPRGPDFGSLIQLRRSFLDRLAAQTNDI